MGGVQTKNIVDIINSASAEAVISAMSNCQAGISQSQSLYLSGTNNNINQTQRASINLSCASNFKMDTNIVNDIFNKLVQNANAEGYGLFDTSAENIYNIKNQISAKVTTELIQSVASNIKQEQTAIATAGSNNNNVNQVQDATLVQSSIMNAIAATGLGNTVGSNFQQSSESVQKNPFDFITDIFNSGYMFIILIILFVIILIIGIFYTVFN